MGLLDDIKYYNLLAEEAKNNIRTIYLNDNRPWVIGFSGGKDSTTVLQLVIEELINIKNDNIPLNKKVYVISSDTMVETPLIISRIGECLKQIKRFALEQNLPIEVQLVRPNIDNTFWVNLIGKGYPVPNQSFRWCTDRMKIEPTNKFIKDKVSLHGEVIVLLGVREGESNSRDRVIKSHNIEGKLIMKHATLSNAFTFAPIRSFTVDDVWNYLLNHESPWGIDNKELFQLYSDSNANECPLIIDAETKEKTGSCGNSRFGCWVCTVVNEDKALTGFVENGEDWLRPLLSYRNWLRAHRDDRAMRMKIRANGNVYLIKLKNKSIGGNLYVIIPKKSGREKITLKIIKNKVVSDNNEQFTLVQESELNSYIKLNKIDLTKGDNPNIIIQKDDGYYMLGLGPYTFEARFIMIQKLLEIQKEYEVRNIKLIADEELRQIRREWFKRGLVEDKLPKIYASIFDDDLNWEQNDIQFMDERQYNILSKFCNDNNVHITPIIEMLQLVRETNIGKMKKQKLEKINEILTKDYLHY